MALRADMLAGQPLEPSAGALQKLPVSNPSPVVITGNVGRHRDGSVVGKERTKFRFKHSVERVLCCQAIEVFHEVLQGGDGSGECGILEPLAIICTL